nr:hypothetical protein HK105_001561 [Polyrhizophydium stewartii]
MTAPRPVPSAPLLRGSVVPSFAYTTIKDRLPVILAKVIDHFVRRQHREHIKGSSAAATEDAAATAAAAAEDTAWDDRSASELRRIRDDIAALKYAMARDRPLEPLVAAADASADEATDVALWNAALDELDAAERSWFKAPWLFIECFMYRLLRQSLLATTTWRDYDLFESEKQASLFGSAESILRMASAALGVRAAADRDAAAELIQFSLWGNQSDLSLFVNAKHDEAHKHQISGKDQLASSSSSIIVNDMDAVLDKLAAIRTGTVVIVLDNAGFELFGDLCLADYITQTTECTVVFEGKLFPWFVSDTTARDFDFVVDECALLADKREHDNLREAVARWRAWVASGRWVLRFDPFWTTPFPFWRMPERAPALLKQLSDAQLVMFKGDLNYRKAIGPIASSGIAPFVMLRTCKSDTVAGLRPGQAAELDAIDKDWMVNGKFGIIQLHQ